MRPPQPPVYVFVIDVSYNAVASGMLQRACETILATLDNLPGVGRTRIGFITFDNTVHFYNLKATLSQPQVLVVPDTCDGYPCDAYPCDARVIPMGWITM